METLIENVNCILVYNGQMYLMKKNTVFNLKKKSLIRNPVVFYSKMGWIRKDDRSIECIYTYTDKYQYKGEFDKLPVFDSLPLGKISSIEVVHQYYDPNALLEENNISAYLSSKQLNVSANFFAAVDENDNPIIIKKYKMTELNAH